MSRCSDKIHCKTWLPEHIVSDKATHSFGAANELVAFMDAWDKAKTESDSAKKKTVRKFNLELQILVESGRD